MALAMTKQEREKFLADLHVGIISIPEDGRGPLTVPVWYAYDPGGEVRVVTARASRKGRLLGRVRRFSLCAQTETPPYRYVSVEGPADRGLRQRRLAARRIHRGILLPCRRRGSLARPQRRWTWHEPRLSGSPVRMDPKAAGSNRHLALAQHLSRPRAELAAPAGSSRTIR